MLEKTEIKNLLSSYWRKMLEKELEQQILDLTEDILSNYDNDKTYTINDLKKKQIEILKSLKNSPYDLLSSFNTMENI